MYWKMSSVRSQTQNCSVAKPLGPTFTMLSYSTHAILYQNVGKRTELLENFICLAFADETGRLLRFPEIGLAVFKKCFHMHRPAAGECQSKGNCRVLKD